VEEVLTFCSIESQQFIECCDYRQKLKAALFRILSQEGTNGLKNFRIAKHVQSCDLNDLPSSNALEALVCSSLSSDISLFERISSSAFRKTNFMHSRERASTQVFAWHKHEMFGDSCCIKKLCFVHS
jgi:hypothetical protein